MFREHFHKISPISYKINPIIKAYIISEAFLWSAWNFITPIFAVFILNNIAGGDVQTAAIGHSIYLISRVVFELIIGQFLFNTHDKKKLRTAIVGMLCLGIAYAGFANAETIPMLFFFYIIAGMGLGIATPAKNALFAIHLDKNRESTEWSISDAVAFICMALASTVGGFIASAYGFHTLFLIACVMNFLGVIPYILTIRALNAAKANA